MDIAERLRGACRPARGRLTLATKLTLARIFCIPVFVLVVLEHKAVADAGGDARLYRVLALLIFGLASLTDALDGYLARRRDQRSRLGAFLDPIADKGLLITTVVVLATHPSSAYTPLPTWFIVLLVARDLVVLLGSLVIHMLTGHVRIRPLRSGKIAIALTMVTLIWILAGLPAAGARWLWSVAGFFIAVSGLLYVRDGALYLQERGRLPVDPESGSG